MSWDKVELIKGFVDFPLANTNQHLCFFNGLEKKQYNSEPLAVSFVSRPFPYLKKVHFTLALLYVYGKQTMKRDWMYRKLSKSEYTRTFHTAIFKSSLGLSSRSSIQRKWRDRKKNTLHYLTSSIRRITQYKTHFVYKYVIKNVAYAGIFQRI